MNNGDSWERTRRYFADLIDDGFDCRPLLTYLGKIAESEFAESFFPFTAPFDFCFSTVESYEARNDNPLMAISCGPDQLVKVKIFTKGSRTDDLKTFKGDTTQAWHIIEDWLRRT